MVLKTIIYKSRVLASVWMTNYNKYLGKVGRATRPKLKGILEEKRNSWRCKKEKWNLAEWKMPYGSGHEGLEVGAFLKGDFFWTWVKWKQKNTNPFLLFGNYHKNWGESDDSIWHRQQLVWTMFPLQFEPYLFKISFWDAPGALWSNSKINLRFKKFF